MGKRSEAAVHCSFVLWALGERFPLSYLIALLIAISGPETFQKNF